MSVPYKIVYSLRILGLSSDATAAEVRSAFRRLARACHPDIVGRQGARRFEQITGAYTFLKSLSPEELRRSEAPETAPSSPKSPGWNSPWSWRRKKSGIPEAEDRQHEEGVRERSAEARAEKNRETRVEAVLNRGELALDGLLRRREEETRNGGIRDLSLRLLSDIPGVRHLALSRLGPFVNQDELLDVVTTLLAERDIDEKTARLVAALSLTPENHHKLARALPGKAAKIPEPLLAHLLHLRDPEFFDRELWERYLQNANAGGVTLILRHWPRDSFLSAATLRILMAGDDAAVLVSLFSAMKQRSAPCPSWASERMQVLLSHPNVAVRVWAKALSPKGAA